MRDAIKLFEEKSMTKINTVRTALECGGVALALLGTGAIFAAEPQVRTQPNVLVLLADDLGYADCGAYGCKDIPTPNIDALAKAGVRFRNGYCSASVCSPSRAGLMSARYQERFGFDANAEGVRAQEDRAPRALDIHQTTLAQRMKSLGYVTGLFGKWHLGAEEGYRPTERGFDEFYGFLPHGICGGKTPMYRGTELVDSPKNHMEQFCVEAISFIDRHQKDPFFLYVPFSAVHDPYVGDTPWINSFEKLMPVERRKYAADASQMDDIVGRILRCLKERGLEENTLIFFLSDNGAEFFGPGHNTPLRGTKWTLWEGGIRVPWIVSWKGHIAGGRTLDSPVISLDIGATAISAAGGVIQADWQLDGVNLLPMLKGESISEPHEALYWRFGPQYAIRKGNWKLVKPNTDMAPHLYDLSKDIGEHQDLASLHPDKVQELQKLWDEWNSKNETPRWADERWDGRLDIKQHGYKR